MTALLPDTQPRVPAGLPGGGRFASKACTTTYRVLAALREDPGPNPPRVEVLANGSTRVSYEAGVAYYAVPAPRCPHGHFARWAAHHCRRCR